MRDDVSVGPAGFPVGPRAGASGVWKMSGMIGLLRRVADWVDGHRARRGMKYVTSQGWHSPEGIACITRKDWEALGKPPPMTHHPNYGGIPPGGITDTHVYISASLLRAIPPRSEGE